MNPVIMSSVKQARLPQKQCEIIEDLNFII